MIQIRSLSKHYEGNRRVLDQVHLDLVAGEFVYVLGGTGAGKTTLLRMLAVEETPTQGDVRLFGYSLAQVNSSTLKTIRRAIGYIPQNIQLLPDFSVLDNVLLGATYAGGDATHAEVRARATEILDRLGLIHLRAVPAGKISGGEAQRVAVARALARKPQLIVADEPTGAQDSAHTWAMMDLIHRANVGGATVVLATHDREIVRKLRKRCAVLHQGKVVIEDSSGLGTGARAWAP